MMLLLLADAASPPPAQPAAPPPHVYLHPPPASCQANSAGEVVVCGSKELAEQYRVRPLDDARYAEAPVRAGADILGGRASAAGAQRSVGGFSAPAAMLTLSWPF